MSLWRFVAIDTLASLIFVPALGLVGYVFADQVDMIAMWFQHAGRALGTLMVLVCRGLALPPLLGETQTEPDGDAPLRAAVYQRGMLSCALYLSALKDVDKRNPNAYHTSRHCTDGGYQNRPLEPAPHVAGRQEKVRAAWWPWRGETSHLYTEHT